MRALIVRDVDRMKIRRAIKEARAVPVPLDRVKLAAVDRPGSVVTLADRKPGTVTAMSWQVLIPQGYRAALSFEYQPIGLCRHLSVSVDTPGRVPTPEAVAVLADEFGFVSFPPERGRVWLEEFDPGHYAVNVVQVEDEQ